MQGNVIVPFSFVVFLICPQLRGSRDAFLRAVTQVSVGGELGPPTCLPTSVRMCECEPLCVPGSPWRFRETIAGGELSGALARPLPSYGKTQQETARAQPVALKA